MTTEKPRTINYAHPGGATYVIHNPETVEHVERNAQIKAVIGTYGAGEASLEQEVINVHSAQYQRSGEPAAKVKVSSNTLELAQYYVNLRDKGARLPKFSRWATGMFAENKKLAQELAMVGQQAASNGKDMYVSDDKFDILRSSSSPHYYSCLGFTASKDPYCSYPDVLPILCKSAGLAVAYTVDPETKHMAGRVYLVSAVRIDNNEKCVLAVPKSGPLTPQDVVARLRAKGHKAYEGLTFGNDWAHKFRVLDMPRTGFHFDLGVWQAEVFGM